MHFSLSDLAADITQNCAESGASLVELAIWETDEPGSSIREFRFYAGDNGKGMSKAELARATDPFVTDGVKHPGRKVGLGIPFLIQTAVDSGGGWRIRSTGKGGEAALQSGGTGKAVMDSPSYAGGSAAGTSVEAWFDLANVDTPPIGDIPGLFRSVLMFTGPEEIVLKRQRKPDLDYEVKKTELMEALGGDLEDVSSLVLLGKYLRSLEGESD